MKTGLTLSAGESTKLGRTKCDTCWQSKAGTEHLLLWCNKSHIPDLHFQFRVAHSNFSANVVGNAFADLLVLLLVRGVFGLEQIEVDERQLLWGVRYELELAAVIDALEGVKEFDGARRQVHHIVRKCT